MKRTAFYGGSFDPVHEGHLAVARTLQRIFSLDAFHFLPAFHAPHKSSQLPASAFHRFAMLSVATVSDERIFVSEIELKFGAKRYTIESLPLLRQHCTDSRVFFVMGSDSWRDITSWKEWEKVLLGINHIVVSRPDYDINFDHVTPAVQARLVDMRGLPAAVIGEKLAVTEADEVQDHIYITDAVKLPVSATEIRADAVDGVIDQREFVPEAVAKYIEKYELYR